PTRRSSDLAQVQQLPGQQIKPAAARQLVKGIVVNKVLSETHQHHEDQYRAQQQQIAPPVPGGIVHTPAKVAHVLLETQADDQPGQQDKTDQMTAGPPHVPQQVIPAGGLPALDRKSTRLNSSHVKI